MNEERKTDKSRAASDEEARPSAPATSSDSVFAQLADAASRAKDEREAVAVFSAVGHTAGLSESGIAPEVLGALLPDEGVVVLPKVSRVAGSAGYRFVKRAFDICACSVALAVLAIPMAVIAIKIKTESPGPIIFSQRRVGREGRVFRLYKFRSMRVDAEVAGARWASENDPRVTDFGRFLRCSRLDEIPQFVNVIKGEMSLIGPRPERPAFHEEFCRRIDGWGQRLLVRPGVTGLAQVKGGYDLLPKEKALMDIEYIEHRGVALDARIAADTLKTIATGSGAR